MLSDSDDDLQNEEVHKLTINEHYANAFQYRKEREELDKLKAKLGSDVSESDLEEEETDSESAESEDEDGEELTPTVDAAILRTLARIRRKDPSIYESGKSVFDEEQEKLAARSAFAIPGKIKKVKDSSKPVTLRQVVLEAQLNPSRSPSPEPLTHVQEQAALRKETISAFHTSADGGDDDDDLLVPREKTKDEQEQEETDYRAFLEREVGDLKDIIGVDNESVEADEESEEGWEEKDRKKKKEKKEKQEVDGVGKQKRKSKEEEDQEFLMNYILNRGWIDKFKDRVPTYKEITKSKKSKASQSDASSASSSDNDPDNEDEAAQSDSSFDSLNDAFETSYNFRFEEPGSSSIPSFPRNIPSLVRREDTKRKDARERRKKRKEEEMEKKREEIRRLKALKMRDVRRKLEVIGREGGILGEKSKGKGKGKSTQWEEAEEGVEMDDALKELDLEGDWDPEKHDQQMAGLYGGDGEWEDAGEVDEDGKPVWKDDIDIGDIQMSDDDAEDVAATSGKKDKKKKKKKKKKGGDDEVEDVGVDIDAMDADVQALKREMGEEEEWDGTEEMRKRKLDEYMEEIYNLEFNDMVGDLPTRFKYVPVAPQAYSLSPVETLLATDKELNEFMSIKRYAPYKNDARKWDAKRQQKLKELRNTLAERSKTGGWLVKDSHHTTGGSGSSGNGRPDEVEHQAKKRKGKKERMKAKAAAQAEENDVDGADDGEHNKMQIDEAEANQNGVNGDSKKAKKKHKQFMDLDGRKETESIEDKGHKRKRDDARAEVQQQQQQKGKGKGKEDESIKPKKKRRRKHKSGGEVGQDQVQNGD